MSQTWVITGANRGIGLEYVRQCLAAGDRVIATARHPDEAEALHALSARYPGALRIERLDSGNGASVAAFAAAITNEAVDILVNNAGLYGGSWTEGAHRQTLEGMDYDLWEEIHRVNVAGPFRVTVALRPHLAKGTRKLVVMMSSDLGSITNNTIGQSHAYRTSKSALNMLTRGLAIDLKGDGIAVVSIAPGWTQTELGGAAATWPVADSVSNQLRQIAGWGPAQSGQFINLLGEPVAW